MFSRYSTLSRYTPHKDPYRIDTACMQNKIGGVSHVKLPSEGYRALAGYSSYSIAVSRYTAPLSSSFYLLFSFSCLFSFSDFPCFFLCVFSFLFQGFYGFREERNPFFFGVSLAFFQKTRVGGSGFTIASKQILSQTSIRKEFPQRERHFRHFIRKHPA